MHTQLLVRNQVDFRFLLKCHVSPFLPPSLSEDGCVVRVVLVKSNRDAANCWRSLLADAYEADPWEFQNMEKKLTLERFQREVSIFGGY